MNQTVLTLLQGGKTEQAVSSLAAAISHSKANAKSIQAQLKAEQQLQLEARIGQMHTLADEARTTLLAEMQQELQGGTEVHLVRCHVRMPDLSNDDATVRPILAETFRNHLSEPLFGMVHFTLKTERGSPWYGHLVATISVHA